MATLEITTMIGCPVMCTFCPQENLRSASQNDSKYLSFENFKKILQSIAPNTRIDFSGMSEPWANKECTNMVVHALERGFHIAIYTTLYGMSRHDFTKLNEYFREYKNLIDVICIHLQDSNNNMKGIIIDDELIELIKNFQEIESEKLFKMQFMTMSENGELHEKLRYLNIELQGFTGIDRAGALNLNQVNGQKVIVIKNKSGPIKCGVTDLYNHNVLLPNGDILLCCMDYDKKHVLGNLFNTPYYEIFRQDPFRDLIVENMNHLGASDKSICRKCDNAFKPHETM